MLVHAKPENTLRALRITPSKFHVSTQRLTTKKMLIYILKHELCLDGNPLLSKAFALPHSVTHRYYNNCEERKPTAKPNLVLSWNNVLYLSPSRRKHFFVRPGQSGVQGQQSDKSMKPKHDKNNNTWVRFRTELSPHLYTTTPAWYKREKNI